MNYEIQVKINYDQKMTSINHTESNATYTPFFFFCKVKCYF